LNLILIIFSVILGSLLEGVDIREQYRLCSLENKKIILQPIVWKKLLEPQLRPFHTENDYKPIFMDARKKLHFKFSMYLWGLQWSSSLKRIIASGSVVIIPTPNPHETVVTELLSQYCPDCYITVPLQSLSNYSDFCDDLMKIVKDFTRDELYEKGEEMSLKLQNFAKERLSLENTLNYMYVTMVQYSVRMRATMKETYDENVLKSIKHYNLIRYNCKVLRHNHLNPRRRPEDDRIRWQYAEWYDDDCRMRLNTTYLMYTAI